MYKIHLSGRYTDYKGCTRWVSEAPFEAPQFDLQDKSSIARIVRLHYPDADDCSGVQVYYHGQEWRS